MTLVYFSSRHPICSIWFVFWGKMALWYCIYVYTFRMFSHYHAYPHLHQIIQTCPPCFPVPACLPFLSCLSAFTCLPACLPDYLQPSAYLPLPAWFPCLPDPCLPACPLPASCLPTYLRTCVPDPSLPASPHLHPMSSPVLYNDMSLRYVCNIIHWFEEVSQIPLKCVKIKIAFKISFTFVVNHKHGVIHKAMLDNLRGFTQGGKSENNKISIKLKLSEWKSELELHLKGFSTCTGWKHSDRTRSRLVKNWHHQRRQLRKHYNKENTDMNFLNKNIRDKYSTVHINYHHRFTTNKHQIWNVNQFSTTLYFTMFIKETCDLTVG